jgi:hypothetical protein
LDGWDKYVPKRIELIGCGGTALTIQDVKASTKDVDFLVPDPNQYKVLIRTLKKLGYRQVTTYGWSRNDGFIFDLFLGKTIYMTELLESPLKKGKHIPIKQFRKIYVSALNDYDLIISKMFRASSVDIEDCVALIHFRGESFDLDALRKRYKATADYDLNPPKMMNNLDALLRQI